MGTIESLNRKLREEMLNEEIFNTILEARIISEQGGRITIISNRSFLFGYGLSYATFIRSELKLSLNEVKMEDNLSLSFKLKNISNITCAEDVQLYVKDLRS